MPLQEQSRPARIAVEQMIQDGEVLVQGMLDLVHRDPEDRVDQVPRRAEQEMRWLEGVNQLVVPRMAEKIPMQIGLGPVEILAVDRGPGQRRFDMRFRAMRATGAWGQAHPWFEAFVPSDRIEEALALAMSLPHFLAELVRFGPLAADGRGSRPASIVLPDGPTHVVALLPSGVPPPFVEVARDSLARLDRAYAALGAKRYLSGWLPSVLAGGLAEHHGDRHASLEEVRARCDPGRLFTSRLTPRDERGLPLRAAR